MELSKKVLAIIIIASVSITLFGIAVWQDWGGIGTALQGAGGPIAQGFYNVLAAPVLWASTGGWPTLAVFYCGFVAVMFGFAYVIYHFDVPNKIKGTTEQQLPVGSMNLPREPAEPERAPEASSTVEKAK